MMKKIVTTILLTIVFLFLSTSPIIAQTLTVSPSSGDTATAFTATLLGFEPEFRHCIRGFKNDEAVWANCEIYTDDEGVASTVIGPFTIEGAYTIRVTKGYADEVGNTATIEISGQVPLQCGNICPANSTECPEECPCILQGGGIWKCEAPPLPPGEEEEPEAPSYIDTAIGPIDVSSPEDFVGSILKFALGIGGGIAVLLIIIGGVQVLTSAGNPEKAKAGQELITSAVSGLLLIIFAVFLLKLIGKDILGIFP